MPTRAEHLRLSLFTALVLAVSGCAGPRGTGDLGLVIERATGSVQVVDTSARTRIARIDGFGDLSHASAVFSRDARYAYVFGRDGGLTKVDLLTGKIEKRIVQAGNAIGGAISQDGKVVAVSNYEPGGVRLFDAGSLAPLAEIPANGANGARSKVVGLVDAPGDRFVFALYDAGEIWLADARDPRAPRVTKFSNTGKQPYDGTVTADGRWYLAGLFGEDGLALLDLWHPAAGARKVVEGYGRGSQPLPVYKMPHLDYIAAAGDRLFVPAAGRHELLVVDARNWKELARVPLAGQPVFVVARPDGRHVWVNFAPPHNDTVQVLDSETLATVRTLKPGKGVLHMEFTPRGEACWVSVRDDNLVRVYDTATFAELAALPADKPSGIFFSARAHRIGQ
ncbi:MAG: protein nirF [Gammaproteobacteria bacterium]|nr:MAG: protein nirF [Gammaproteobacteria bacterium]